MGLSWKLNSQCWRRQLSDECAQSPSGTSLATAAAVTLSGSARTWAPNPKRAEYVGALDLGGARSEIPPPNGLHRRRAWMSASMLSAMAARRSLLLLNRFMIW